METTTVLTIKRHAPQDQQRSTWNAVRILTCGAALLGLGASLWAAPGLGSCGTCKGTSQLVPGIPLAWIGAGFYALMTLALLWRGTARVVTGGFFAALGVHVVLLVLMVREQMFCAACVTAGGAALLGAMLGLARPMPSWLPAATFLPAGIVTWCVVALAHPLQTRYQPLPVVAASAPASTNPGHVTLVVYEREGCKHCLDFEENVLPQLQQALGGTLEIQRLDATIAMESPTIIVEGKTSQTFVGETDEKTLEDAVRELR